MVSPHTLKPFDPPGCAGKSFVLPKVLTAVSDPQVRQAMGAICVFDRACSPGVGQASDGERAVEAYHRPSMPCVLEFVVSVPSAPSHRMPQVAEPPTDVFVIVHAFQWHKLAW